jgi:hypothetical protein
MSLIYLRCCVVEIVKDEGAELCRNVENRLLIVVTSEPRKEETSSTPLLNNFQEMNLIHASYLISAVSLLVFI